MHLVLTSRKLWIRRKQTCSPFLTLVAWGRYYESGTDVMIFENIFAEKII
jgi:hypothetical protein